jgi:transcriptional regulator with XRE-family HTH domain
MKKISEQAVAIRSLLREKLSQHGLTYKSLAEQLEVSEPTIKRWMTKDDWPLDALLQTFQILGISWSDLEGVQTDFSLQHATEKQEIFVSQSPKESYVYLLLATGHYFEEIRKKLDLSFKSLEAIFLKLDKFDFVAYTGPNQIRPLVKLPLKWTSSGKFSKRYFKICADLLYYQLLMPNSGFNHKFDSKKPLIYASELMLTGTALARFKADLYELIEKYKATAKPFTNRSENPAGLLLALDEFPLWQKAMWEAES